MYNFLLIYELNEVRLLVCVCMHVVVRVEWQIFPLVILLSGF